MKTKIIHFFRDKKFFHLAQKQFDKVENVQNTYFYYGESNYSTSNVTNIDYKNFDYSKIKNSIIVFHSLPDSMISRLKDIHTSNQIVWLIFGYETYGDRLLYSENKLLDKISKEKFANNNNSFSIKESLKVYINPIRRKWNKNLAFTKKENEKLKKSIKISNLKYLNYFGIGFKEELILQSKLLGFKRTQFNFWFYNIDEIIQDKTIPKEKENWIMIGHSGFPNGNHLDIFENIDTKIKKDTKLIIPLSYGEELYIKEVKIDSQKRNFNSTFLESFISLEEYNNYLKKCNIAIFNNRRQQAIGNIISLIYFGCKVYLSERNTFYKFLKRNKISIFSYDQLTAKSLHEPLPLSLQKHNRKIISEIFSEKSLQQQLNSSIKHIQSKMLKNISL